MQSNKKDNLRCFKDLIKQNYEVTKARGLITDDTTTHEFVCKILEEFTELSEEVKYNSKRDLSIYEILNKYKHRKKDISYEMADIILTVCAFAYHIDIDIESALKEKIEINRKRIVY